MRLVFSAIRPDWRAAFITVSTRRTSADLAGIFDVCVTIAAAADFLAWRSLAGLFCKGISKIHSVRQNTIYVKHSSRRPFVQVPVWQPCPAGGPARRPQ
jgi:hypothetical protein